MNNKNKLGQSISFQQVL